MKICWVWACQSCLLAGNWPSSAQPALRIQSREFCKQGIKIERAVIWLTERYWSGKGMLTCNWVKVLHQYYVGRCPKIISLDNCKWTFFMRGQSHYAKQDKHWRASSMNLEVQICSYLMPQKHTKVKTNFKGPYGSIGKSTSLTVRKSLVCIQSRGLLYPLPSQQ